MLCGENFKLEVIKILGMIPLFRKSWIFIIHYLENSKNNWINKTPGWFWFVTFLDLSKADIYIYFKINNNPEVVFAVLIELQSQHIKNSITRRSFRRWIASLITRSSFSFLARHRNNNSHILIMSDRNFPDNNFSRGFETISDNTESVIGDSIHAALDRMLDLMRTGVICC